MAATNSSSQQKTQNSATNQQVGAGTGGAAIGANSSGNVINVTNTDLQTTMAALSANRDVSAFALDANAKVARTAILASKEENEQNVATIAKVAGTAGAVLQSTFTSFVGALQQQSSDTLTVQNNATQAALNVIANAAPQTQAALTEHLAGSAVIPAGQEIGLGSFHITVTELLLIAAVGVAAFALFKYAAK